MLDPTVPLQEALNRARSGGVWHPKPIADMPGCPQSPGAAGLIKALRGPAAIVPTPPVAGTPPASSPPPLPPPPRAAVHAVPALPPPPGPRRAVGEVVQGPAHGQAQQLPGKQHELCSNEEAGGGQSPVPACHAEETAPASGQQQGTPDAAHQHAEPAPPPTLVCPITGEVFLDPVCACDGKCYEREAIEVRFNTLLP